MGVERGELRVEPRMSGSNNGEKRVDGGFIVKTGIL